MGSPVRSLDSKTGCKIVGSNWQRTFGSWEVEDVRRAPVAHMKDFAGSAVVVVVLYGVEMEDFAGGHL